MPAVPAPLAGSAGSAAPGVWGAARRTTLPAGNITQEIMEISGSECPASQTTPLFIADLHISHAGKPRGMRNYLL